MLSTSQRVINIPDSEGAKFWGFGTSQGSFNSNFMQFDFTVSNDSAPTVYLDFSFEATGGSTVYLYVWDVDYNHLSTTGWCDSV